MSEALFQKWHRIVHAKDMSALRHFMSEKIVFRSPVVREPYHGRDSAILLLSNVIEVFGPTFTYHRRWFRPHGMVLEFTAIVDGKELHGVDIIEFDDADDKIVKFEVMVRPFGSTMSLRKHMAERLAALKGNNVESKL